MDLVCFVHFDLEMCFATTACTFSKSQPPKAVRTPSVLNIVLRATTACTFSTSQPPKVVRTPGVLNIFTSKPQRRALFRHLNCQKWYGPGVFCTFWLGNVLRATTACAFSTSQLVKMVRSWCVLYILTWKCASCSWLRTRRFGEPTIRPSGATNHWKNSVSRLSYLFAHLHLISSDSFSSTLLSSNPSLPSDPFHLCFSSVHIVGSLTSKLPSIIYFLYLHTSTIQCYTYPMFIPVSSNNTPRRFRVKSSPEIACSRLWSSRISGSQLPRYLGILLLWLVVKKERWE